MPLVRRFYSTPAERLAALGPTIPAPERYVNDEGFLVYALGDPVPVAIAKELGWMARDEELPPEEPKPLSDRRRRIKATARDIESSA